MKVIFMGTPDFAVPSLDVLLKHHEVLAVITQPDTKKGRGNKYSFSPVKEKAMANSIPVLQPTKIRDKEFIKTLQAYHADIFVVAAYGQILSEAILQMPKFGCINVHGSLLPKYRGAAPIQWAIINGEQKTGVTIMKMDKGIDTGDMILKKEIQIEEDDTAQTLFDKMAVVGAEALIIAMEQIENLTAVFEKQDNQSSSYAKIIEKEMGHLDFSKSSQDIINLIRGLVPWPSAYCYYEGEIIKIFKAEILCSNDSGKGGTILEVLPNKGIVVATGDGSILITEIQATGSKRMLAKEYLKGHKISVGKIFS